MAGRNRPSLIIYANFSKIKKNEGTTIFQTILTSLVKDHPGLDGPSHKAITINTLVHSDRTEFNYLHEELKCRAKKPGTV